MSYGFETGEIVEVEIPARSGQWHFATLTEVGEGLVGFVLETPLKNGGHGSIGFSYIRKPSSLAGHNPAPYPWEKEAKEAAWEKDKEDGVSREATARQFTDEYLKEWKECDALEHARFRNFVYFSTVVLIVALIIFGIF